MDKYRTDPDDDELERALGRSDRRLSCSTVILQQYLVVARRKEDRHTQIIGQIAISIRIRPSDRTIRRILAVSDSESPLLYMIISLQGIFKRNLAHDLTRARNISSSYIKNVVCHLYISRGRSKKSEKIYNAQKSDSSNRGRNFRNTFIRSPTFRLALHSRTVYLRKTKFSQNLSVKVHQNDEKNKIRT
jgi:hypothetical protein